LQIRHFFETVVSAEDVVNSKPAPDCFLEAAARLGRQPAECIVFEDSISGIEAAAKAGMRTAVITTTLVKADIPLHPNIIAVSDNFENGVIDLILATEAGNGHHA